MTDEIIKNLGPLTPLVGVWEGDEGEDIAPSGGRGTETNKFRERITFEPLGPCIFWTKDACHLPDP